MITDAELVAQVRGGNVDAFGELCVRYERTLLALALVGLRDFHGAEDVVQATLLRAFKQLPSLREDAKFGAWLVQIAHSQVVDAIRSRPSLVTIPLVIDPPSTEELATGQRHDFEQLLTWIAGLPDHERVLIGLRYFDGHSVAQLSQITGRPIGTVTKQLSRAIARLRTSAEKENAR